MPFNPKHSIRKRLSLAYGLFSGLLLLVLWLFSLAYVFYQERDELLQTVRTQANMLAAQSSAASMFGDHVALSENLSTLNRMEKIKWAAIVAPDTARTESKPLVLAQYGSLPVSLASLLDALQGHQLMITGLYESVVAQEIQHDDIVRGHVIIAVDHREDLYDFLEFVVTSLLLSLGFLATIVLVFTRLIDDVLRPVSELADITRLTDQSGIPQIRAQISCDDELGQLSQSFNIMLDKLAARDHELLQSRDDLRALSQRLLKIREEEHTRIAHEIHDELGQRLTAIKFTLAREGTVREAADMVDATIKVVRNISWELRPSLLDSVGLAAAIEWLAQDFQKRIGMRCGIEIPKEMPAIHPDQATDIFRICQELLTNVARHANASRADILLGSDERQLHIEVRDNGSGIRTKPGHRRSLGLLGIEERIKRWDGRIVITTRPEIEGTRIRAEVPISPTDH